MFFLINLLSNIATAAASAGSAKCIGFTWDEPECPQELL